MYRSGKAPQPLKVDFPDGLPGSGWEKLEENSLGEFGWKEVLKQFLDTDRAAKVAASWDGDDYITFEQKATKRLRLFARLRFNTSDNGSAFFDAYSEALRKKYTQQEHVSKGDQFLSFDSPDGAVLLRCVQRECITAEGADSTAFLEWLKKLGWPTIKPIAARCAGIQGLLQSRVFTRCGAAPLT